MQLALSFAVLFNAIVLVISLPVQNIRQVSLPLKRSPINSLLHPQIVFSFSLSNR